MQNQSLGNECDWEGRWAYLGRQVGILGQGTSNLGKAKSDVLFLQKLKLSPATGSGSGFCEETVYNFPLIGFLS